MCLTDISVEHCEGVLQYNFFPIASFLISSTDLQFCEPERGERKLPVLAGEEKTQRERDQRLLGHQKAEDEEQQKQ